MLRDARVDPSSENSSAFSYACNTEQLEVVRLLLRDKRADPAVLNNNSIRQACLFGYSRIVELLLNDERVDPSANHNEALQNADAVGDFVIFKMLMCNAKVKKELFLSPDTKLTTLQLECMRDVRHERTNSVRVQPGKLLETHSKELINTTALCIGRVWRTSGVNLPNDIVRSVLSDWCRTRWVTSS